MARLREFEQKWLIALPRIKRKLLHPILDALGTSKGNSSIINGEFSGLETTIVSSLEDIEGVRKHDETNHDIRYVQKQSERKRRSKPNIPEVRFTQGSVESGGTLHIGDSKFRIYPKGSNGTNNGQTLESHVNGFMDLLSRYVRGEEDISFRYRCVEDGLGDGHAAQQFLITAKKVGMFEDGRLKLERNREFEFHASSDNDAQEIFRYMGFTAGQRKTKLKQVYTFERDDYTIECAVVSIPIAEYKGRGAQSLKFIEIEVIAPKDKKRQVGYLIYRVAKDLGISQPERTLGVDGLMCVRGYSAIVSRLDLLRT